MKKLLLLITLFAISSIYAADNMLPQGFAKWTKEFRPSNHTEFFSMKESGNSIDLAKYVGATFSRIYIDLPVKAGKVYNFNVNRFTEKGILTALMIHFGQSKTKSFSTSKRVITPIVNGEWSKFDETFEIPADCDYLRVDLRLDGYGEITFKDPILRELMTKEVAQWKKDTTIPEFKPNTNNDYSLKSGKYYRINFNATGKKDGSNKIQFTFHPTTGSWFREGEISFFVEGKTTKEFSEIIVVPENVDGIRFVSDSANVKDLKFTEFSL